MPWRAESNVVRVGCLIAVLAAAVSPFWLAVASRSHSTVTLGRVLLLALAVATVGLVSDHAPRDRLPPLPLTLFVGGLSALWLVITASAVTRGCFCGGDYAGFTELALLSGMLAVWAALVPRLRPYLLVAAGTACAIAAALGLLRIADIGQAAAGSISALTDNRIGGPYGNPNFLGFAIAVGIPITAVAVLRGRRARRLAALAAFVLIGIAITETYSRGAVLAAASGGLVALALLPATAPRRLGMLVAGAALLALAGVVGYSTFDRARTSADLANVLPKLVRQAGWTTLPTGLLPAPVPASLAGAGPQTVRVRTDRVGQGASIGLGRLRYNTPYRVTFQVSASSPFLPIDYGLANDDNVLAAGTVVTAAHASGRWREFVADWRPRSDADTARLYVWQTSGPADLLLRRVTVADPGGRRDVGSQIGQSERLSAAAAARIEHRDVGSRKDVARLALRAFGSAPLTGIGWARFEAYARARNPKGNLATHDEYLRFAAELGVVGVMLAAIALAGVLTGAWRIVTRRPGVGLSPGLGAMIVGGVVTGLVGLIFVNGLETPAAAAPIGVVMALGAAATPWWRSGHDVDR